MAQSHTSALAAYSSTFTILTYWITDGLWNIELLAATPPPGGQSNVVVQIPQAEMPDNINQNQLRDLLKKYLGWQLNQTFAPLNTAILNNTAITLP